MTVAMSRAAATGSRACVCASTGNTAASAAAYAARAGMECFVVVPAGKIALGKAVQVLAHGARIVQIEGNFDAALKLSKRIAEELGDVTLVNSVNPDRIEGEDRGLRGRGSARRSARRAGPACRKRRQHHLVLEGLREWRRAGTLARPRMLGFQAEGASPLVAGTTSRAPRRSRAPSG